MNLRILVKADGERVLQYLNYYQDENEVRLCGWQDVPTIPQWENPTVKADVKQPLNSVIGDVKVDDK